LVFKLALEAPKGAPLAGAPSALSFALHTHQRFIWMNMVERFFRDLSQQAILPGSFGSVAELVRRIVIDDRMNA
jgi:hypothetical protein